MHAACICGYICVCICECRDVMGYVYSWMYVLLRVHVRVRANRYSTLTQQKATSSTVPYYSTSSLKALMVRMQQMTTLVALAGSFEGFMEERIAMHADAWLCVESVHARIQYARTCAHGHTTYGAVNTALMRRPTKAPTSAQMAGCLRSTTRYFPSAKEEMESE